MGIYSFLCLANNKLWFGQGKNVQRRIRDHIKRLKKGIDSPHLQSAWDKYGPSSFVYGVVEEVSLVKDLSPRESFWIEKLGTWEREKGFNLERVIPGSKSLSDETKLKISRSMLGNQNGSFRLGIKISQEGRMNMSKSATGRALSEETKKKLSERRKALGLKPPTLRGSDNPRYDSTLYPLIHENGETRDATKYEMSKLGVSVRNLLSGKSKSSKGWRLRNVA